MKTIRMVTSQCHQTLRLDLVSHMPGFPLYPSQSWDLPGSQQAGPSGSTTSLFSSIAAGFGEEAPSAKANPSVKASRSAVVRAGCLSTSPFLHWLLAKSDQWPSAPGTKWRRRCTLQSALATCAFDNLLTLFFFGVLFCLFFCFFCFLEFWCFRIS